MVVYASIIKDPATNVKGPFDGMQEGQNYLVQHHWSVRTAAKNMTSPNIIGINIKTK